MVYNFVTKEHALADTVQFNFWPNVCFQLGSRILADPNLKTITSGNSCYTVADRTGRSDIYRGQKGTSHKLINARIVAGTMWKSTGKAESDRTAVIIKNQTHAHRELILWLTLVYFHKVYKRPKKAGFVVFLDCFAISKFKQALNFKAHNKTSSSFTNMGFPSIYTNN